MPGSPDCTIWCKAMMGMEDSVDYYNLFYRVIVRDSFKNDFSRENVIARFDEHNAAVVRECPPDKLLVFEAKDGWGPLCKFLGKSIPDQPYPHVSMGLFLLHIIVDNIVVCLSYVF
jgi:hypothetical protein